MPGAQGAACPAASAFSATTQPGPHRPWPDWAPGESPPGTSRTWNTQKLLDAQEYLLLLWRTPGRRQFSSKVIVDRSPPPGTIETIPRPFSGHQHLPIPTASPKASHPPHTSHPLHQGCSCPHCSWKCSLPRDSPPFHMLGWTDGPKGTYPQEEAQSLGAMPAVAEGHEEDAVRGKDSHPARAAACDRLARPGAARLAGQHGSRKERQHPTEQGDVTLSATRGDRRHLTGGGMLWGQRQLLGQEEDRALDLAGATWGSRGGDSATDWAAHEWQRSASHRRSHPSYPLWPWGNQADR